MSLVSLYDEASLWMTPSGAKDGKLFSQLPTDGSGDFTFSRGSNLAATRVDVNGLIEKGRENLIKHSNTFNASSWGNFNGASGQLGYDGSNDAWRYDSSSSVLRLQQLQGYQYDFVRTYSIYAKYVDTQWISLQIAGATNETAWFDVQNGVLGNLINGFDSSITSVGNGWYRCTISGATANQDRVRLYVVGNNGSGTTIDGSVLIQDAQLEIGLAATDYIESGATTGKAGLLEDEPRFDYSGGATCPSLLLEPSRTNLVTQSEYFATYFSTSGTLIYNEAASPEGVQNGTKIYPTSTGSFKGLSKAFGSTLSSVPYVLSVFAKAGEFEHLYFYNVGSPNGAGGVWFNLTTGSVGTNQAAWTSAKMEDFGNGWYRCSAVITPGGSSDNLYILLADSNGSVTATTNGTDGFYIYGAQLEQGSYPTSYIPTYGTSQTRSAEESSLTGFDFFPNGEGTAMIEFELDEITISGYPELFRINNPSDTTDFVFCYIFEPLAGDVRIGYRLDVDNSKKIEASRSIDLGTNKMVVRIQRGACTAFLNGTEIAPSQTYNGVADVNMTSLRINAQSFIANERIKQFVTFPTPLTDSEMVALTKLD